MALENIYRFFCSHVLNKTLGLSCLLIMIAAIMPIGAKGQNFGIKTNALYLATATPNIAVEGRIADRWSADMSVGYNPWTFSDNKKLRHIALQCEVRRWLDSTFSGHFFAANALYSHYNIGGIRQPIYTDLKDYRYQGNLGGIGLGYGYNKRLSDRWSIEFELALGLIYTRYNKYKCATCGSKVGNGSRALFSPTKIAVDIVYYLK